MSATSIAIVGAGMGGLTLAALLRRIGVDAKVYEQAPRFARLGAGIQMSPNAMKVLRGLGLEDRVRSVAFQPRSWMNREWDTGAMKYELPLRAAAEQHYAAPYLLMHRADLHAALASIVPEETLELGKRLVDAQASHLGVTMTFEDGTRADAAALVGADGVHSRVRELLLGPERPKFTGRVAYRTVFPASLIQGGAISECTKWWGPDRHIVIYYVTAARDEVYFVTSLPEPDWTRESWSATGSVDELRVAFSGFHDEVRRVLAACPQVHKWAIVVRDPLPAWSGRRMVMLGDACHPMTPYMAQGAAMAMEDAIVLARCIKDDQTDLNRAFARFEATRKERTSQVQQTSNMNTWMRQATDPGWVYGYDAWSAMLDPGPSLSAAE